MQVLTNTLFSLVRRNAKAIAAFVTGVLVSLFLRFNVQVDPTVQAAVDSLVIAVIVWLVPNRE